MFCFEHSPVQFGEHFRDDSTGFSFRELQGSLFLVLLFKAQTPVQPGEQVFEDSITTSPWYPLLEEQTPVQVRAQVPEEIDSIFLLGVDDLAQAPVQSGEHVREDSITTSP